MSEAVFVSFIVPSLNSSDTIGKCLESIQSINYPKDRFEIIVADNHSNDDTVAIAKKFTSNIIVDGESKIAKLRNDGANKSRGDFLAFIDSDCVLPGNWLNDALGYFKDERIGMVGFTPTILEDSANWINKAWNVHAQSIARHKKEHSWLAARAIVVRKNVFFDVDGFDESLETCEDVEFGYRIQKKYRIISNEKLACRHLKDPETLTEFFRKERWRGAGSLAVTMKYITKQGEILSLAALFYYLILSILLIPAMIATVAAGNPFYLMAVSLGILLPLITMTFNTCLRAKRFNYFWQLFVLYTIYTIARITAVFK